MQPAGGDGPAEPTVCAPADVPAPVTWTWIDTVDVAPGSPLMTLSGGALAEAVDVPLWLDVTGDPDPEKCIALAEVGAQVLHDGRILVSQDSMHCGVYQTCKTWDPATSTWTQARCVEAAFFRAYALEPIAAPDWYVVVSAGEGVGTAQLVRYTPELGVHGDGLRVDLGYMDHGLTVVPCSDDSFELETACPLPKGCDLQSPRQMPLRRYRWHPRGDLQRVP